MNYADIKYCDVANGVGVRTSLFVSGCRHHCPGCFNAEVWDFAYGQPFTTQVEDQIIESLRPPYVTGLSLLGGEPFEPENQPVLAPFVERVRAEFPSKGIWLWTGFSWEELQRTDCRAATADLPRILDCLDVMVDGRFLLPQRDITLRFRGSPNQRIIDVPQTREARQVVLWQDEAIFSSHRW